MPFPETFNAADAYFRQIYYDSVNNHISRKEAEQNYFAKMEIYVGMAHYVAKTLKMRPNDILDTWGVPELVVAYGLYTNEITASNYDSWKKAPAEVRAKEKIPDEYNVMFFTAGDLEDE